MNTKSTTTLALAATLAAALGTTGCTGLSSTEQSTLSGGAIGATAGAVGTAITGGCVSCGAALGGAAGAATGYIVDKSKKK